MLLLEGYDVWPKPISIEKIGETQVDNRKMANRLVEGEKNLIQLNVFTMPRLNAKSYATIPRSASLLTTWLQQSQDDGGEPSILVY